MPRGISNSDQYDRKITLLLQQAERGLDLSQMQIRFEVSQGDAQTGIPTNAVITVLNLDPATAAKAQSEYSKVILQAGYQSPGYSGIIFNGEIVQVRRGKIDPVTTYTEIFASESDMAWTQAVVSHSAAPGSSPEDTLNGIMKDSKLPDQWAGAYSFAPSTNGLNTGYHKVVTGYTYPRGKAVWGMWRDEASKWARQQQASLSIVNGEARFIPLDGYLPGQAVVLNSDSGMVGLPEQTENGIQVRCLLNPRIVCGSLININEADIQRMRAPMLPGGFGQTQGAFVAKGSGIYKVLVVEHSGDTRGNDWYSYLTCIASNENGQIQPYGTPINP
jgi:hypothetical protein